MQQQVPAQPPGDPWLYGAGKPAPYSPSQKAFAPKQLQEMPNYYYQPKASVNDDLLASGNKWKLPMMGSTTPQQQQQQQQAVPKEQRSKKGRGSSWGSQGPSRFAQRLYRNEQLQALAAQDQEQQQRAWQLLQQGGRGPGPEAQPVSPQASRGVASDDEMPTPPGFFASREEAQEFMAWVSAKRAARMKQLEKSHDKEIVGIAAVYLVAALCIIGLSLTSSPL